jgi:hypothetical protein
MRARVNVMAGIVPRVACSVKRKDYKILWWRCGVWKCRPERQGKVRLDFSAGLQSREMKNLTI